MASSKNDILNKLDQLMTAKLNAFENRVLNTQRSLTQEDIIRIQNSSNSDTFSFKKKGNEEQYKVNSQALEKLKTANGYLKESSEKDDYVTAAQQKISEGIDILTHRQKLIKLADSSESGWRVVQEYEAHPLAEDSDDEKKIYRAQMKANRKLQQEKRSRARRYSPYSFTANRSTTATTALQPSQQLQRRTQPSSTGRKPGLCFRCGRPGHWRKDCLVVNGPEGNVLNENQISAKFLSFDSKKEVSLEKKVVKTPINRLKSCSKHWEEAGANTYMLDIVNNGYKLPFKTLPQKVELKNNKSSRENVSFVTSEIESLLEKGCISEVNSPPYVVNPLTVAYGRSGRRRLVLDCRHINPDLFKYKCCFEDQSIARQIFTKGDYLFSFDIRSAYHHIMIHEEHRKYIGFAWESDQGTKYYVYNVLLFGVSTAGFIFTKLMRILIKKWRSKGYCIVVFLDDGLGGASSLDMAKKASTFINTDLSNFGFLIAEDKCQWAPVQSLVWLGYYWNTDKGTLSVKEERIENFLKLVEELMQNCSNGQILFPVRKVARIVGQLISMQSAIGQSVRLRSRSLYQCIISRASWEAPVMLSSEALSEMIFWQENIKILNESTINTYQITDDSNPINEQNVFCDASGAGFGGYTEGQGENSHVIGCWSETECGFSSTWRELEAVHRVLKSNIMSFKGQPVTVNTDNKKVASILKIGSKKPYLQNIAIKVDDICKKYNLRLNAKWLPRKQNEEADFLSRCTDSDDWQIKSHVFTILTQKWGPYTCDLFACSYNTKCTKFFSKYWCPGTSGINALNINWQGENSWMVPPPLLAVQCINKIAQEKCKCTLVLPIWRSAPFWSKIFPDGKNAAKFVHDMYYFQPGRLTSRGRGRNGIFDGRPLTFGLIAIRFE